MVEDDPRFQVVAEASTLSSFRKKLTSGRPEVALLDCAMASQDLEFTTALLQSDLHSASIVFLTVSESTKQKQEMLPWGASALVSKWCSSPKLRSAVWRACTERRPPDTAPAKPSLADSSAPFVVGPQQRIEKLTHRERELLSLVCSGLKNKEIALWLGIAESTVWHHLPPSLPSFRWRTAWGSPPSLIVTAWFFLPNNPTRRPPYKPRNLSHRVRLAPGDYSLNA